MPDPTAQTASEVETEIVESRPHVPLIHRAIVRAMQRLTKIAKNRETSGGEKFSYRGIEDAMSALQPVLIDIGLHINMSVVSVDYDSKESKSGNFQTVCFMRMRFDLICVEDGSSITSEVASEGVDVSDKASNKALSNCLKYWIFQLFMIPTKEMRDSEDDIPPKGDGMRPMTPRREKAPPAVLPKPPAPVPPYLFKVEEEIFIVSGAYAKTVNEAASMQMLQQTFGEGTLRAKEYGVNDEEMFPWDPEWTLENAKLGVLVLRARTEKAYKTKHPATGEKS
jgi:ERF superfamily